MSSLELHPYFSMLTMEYDMALIKLSKPNNGGWPDDRVIGELSSPERDERIYLQDKPCFIAGWGKDETKSGKLRPTTDPEAVEVDIVEDVKCNGAKMFIPEAHACVKVAFRDGPCKKDVGGPLVCKQQKRWTMVGVYSYTLDKGEKFTPCDNGNAVVGKVSGHRQWIENVIAGTDTGMLRYYLSSKWRVLFHYYESNQDGYMNKTLGEKLFTDYLATAPNTDMAFLVQFCWQVYFYPNKTLLTVYEFMSTLLTFEQLGLTEEQIHLQTETCVVASYSIFDDNADGQIDRDEHRRFSSLFGHTNVQLVDKLYTFYKKSDDGTVSIEYLKRAWTRFSTSNTPTKREVQMMNLANEMVVEKQA